MVPFERDSIRELRESLAMSQREFADHLGVPQTTVNRWETGRTTPNADYLGMMVDLARRHSRTFTPFAETTPRSDRVGIATEAAAEWIRRSRGPRGKDPGAWRELFLQMLGIVSNRSTLLGDLAAEAEDLDPADMARFEAVLGRAQAQLEGGGKR